MQIRLVYRPNSELNRARFCGQPPAVAIASLLLLAMISCFGLVSCGSPAHNISANSTSSTGAQLSAESISFGSVPMGTAMGPKALTISNSQNTALNISSIAVSGANAKDFTETNTCGSAIAAGGTCSVDVTFKPSAQGNRTGILSIADEPTSTPQNVMLTGTAIVPAPVITISPASLNFGSYTVGTSAGSSALTVKNSGNAALTITAVSMSGTNAPDFPQTNNCTGSIAAGGTCAVQISFKPSTVGARTASLRITDNASGSPQSVAISGTGTAKGAPATSSPAPIAVFSPASLSFVGKTVGSATAAQSVKLSNSGTGSLSVSGISLSGTNSKDFSQTNNCTTSLGAGASCTINVTFTPSATGGRTAVLSVADNASGSPQALTLSGAIPGSSGTVSLTPSSLAFSTLPITLSSVAQTVTLTNSGTAALTLTSIAVTGASATEFIQNNTCGRSVAAGGNCSIVVLFVPSLFGTQSATLVVSDNAPGSPQIVPLSGGGSHDIVLSWTASASADIVGYDIYRGTTSGGESPSPLNSSPVTGTSYTDASVTTGDEYYYIVTSVTSDGSTQSVPSPETSATVP